MRFRKLQGKFLSPQPSRSGRGSSTAEPRHLFHISRVWGSRHGGSVYSRRLAQELHDQGWRVTLVAERFDLPPQLLDALDANAAPCNHEACARSLHSGVRSSDVLYENGPRNKSLIKSVRLKHFFRRNPGAWLPKALEAAGLCRQILAAPGALVIVQGDLPRLIYLWLQLWVPLIFIRQDGILTCPGNNRFLQRSRAVCRQPAGWSCLGTHRKEGCLGDLPWPRQVARLAFRLRDRVLLRGIRHFVGNSHYTVRAHCRPGAVLYPSRAGSKEPGKQPERDLHRLVFCGRLEAVKGAEEALRILSLLPEPYYLEILGDGPERGRLAKAAWDLQLDHRVAFRGWVDEPTRDRWLAAAGVLLMTSLWDEAFGMAGLEAMAQGTPVVAYDVGGVSEWCGGDAGELVRCGDVRRAAVAVLQLTRDTAHWTVHSGAALQVANQQFPVGRFEHELAKMLAEL